MATDEIRTGEDLELALARLDEVWNARPGDADWEERRALVDRIAEYEDRHVHIPPPDPVDAIVFRMEQDGLRAKDLIPFIGSAPKVSEVLARKRALSKEMIRRLHEGLGIPLASLLGVAHEIPEGFVQVDWVLPEGVVWNVTHAAAQAGVSENEWVARGLMVIACATSGLRAFTGETQPSTPQTFAPPKHLAEAA
jgi:antitoxin component HigA of HigAB toxin-antitoxin module